MEKLKTIKAWAGIVDGKIFVEPNDTFHDKGCYAIYRTRKEARADYQKVVPIFITISSSPREVN